MHDTTSGPHGPANPFRQYAETVYTRPGVAELLLQLQDRHGLNINMLLLLLWLGEQQIALSASQLLQLQKAIAGLDLAIIQPLRQVRRQIHQQQLAASLYEQAKQLELALEYQVIDTLYARSRDFSPASDATFCARQNLMLYVSAAAPASRSSLEHLLGLTGTHI